MSQDWAVPLRGVPVNLEHPSNVLEDPESWRLDGALVTYAGAESIEAVASLREVDVPVVHLGGDFRLRDPEVRREQYGSNPEVDELLANGSVAYGLTELYRAEIDQAEIVANPGCYPDASVLGLAPLAREGLIESVHIEAYSGTSGGGIEKAAEYRSASEDIIKYGENGHRHVPEIEQELAALGSACTVEFRPHAIKDVFQGMSVSCTVTLNRDAFPDEIEALYRDAYRDEPFVEVVSGPSPVTMDNVRETNLCRMYVAPLQAGEGTKFSVKVVIDNLWKGASGQAVQNLNRMLGLPEETGLEFSLMSSRT